MTPAFDPNLVHRALVVKVVIHQRKGFRPTEFFVVHPACIARTKQAANCHEFQMDDAAKPPTCTACSTLTLERMDHTKMWTDGRIEREW